MGAVARGGLRWSDRRDDFRTEVLGLMKAQNVKNTLIVPAGAKGGFVARRLTPTMDRDEQQRTGIAAYRNFIGGLLDLTDNLDGRRLVPQTQAHQEVVGRGDLCDRRPVSGLRGQVDQHAQAVVGERGEAHDA